MIEVLIKDGNTIYGDFRYKGARYRIAIIKSAKEL